MARMKKGHGDLAVGNTVLAFLLATQTLFIILFISWYVGSVDNVTIIDNNEELVKQLQDENLQWKEKFYSLAQSKEVICKYEEDTSFFPYFFSFIMGILATIIGITYVGPYMINKYKKEDTNKNDKRRKEKVE